jgi:hypothetical protein
MSGSEDGLGSDEDAAAYSGVALNVDGGSPEIFAIELAPRDSIYILGQERIAPHARNTSLSSELWVGGYTSHPQAYG